MSHYAEETYTVYDERQPVARKPHYCDACGETISPGHRYTRIGIIFEKEASTVIRCLRCQKIHLALRDRGREDQLWPDEKLNCGEEYRQHWGEDPPPELVALAFLTQDEAQEKIGKRDKEKR